MADPAAEEPRDEGAEQRQEDDEVVHHGDAQPFIMLMSSTEMVPLFR